MPSESSQGQATSKASRTFVADQRAKKTLIITDRGVAKAGLFFRPQALLVASGVKIAVIDTTPSSIIMMPEDELKVGIVSPKLMPDFVIAEPELTIGR